MDKHTLQTLGFALVILGFLLLLITTLYSSVTNCPANGCPPVLPVWYWVGILVLSSGPALIVAGIILLIIARRMKPEQPLKE